MQRILSVILISFNDLEFQYLMTELYPFSPLEIVNTEYQSVAFFL
jgi:hypothetical protein